MNTPISNDPNFTGFQQAGQPPVSTVFTPAPSRQKNSVKYIILVCILLLALGGLIAGLGKARSFLSSAESACTPANISEMNLTPNSVEITFRTEKTCLTEMSYGTSPESMLLRVPEEVAASDHHFKLSPLLPSTTYYYQVVVDGKKVGVSRSFLTKIAQSRSEGEAISPAVPTPVPTKASSFTLEEFEENYGTADSTLDIDKNGIVNSADWILYQKK